MKAFFRRSGNRPRDPVEFPGSSLFGKRRSSRSSSPESNSQEWQKLDLDLQPPMFFIPLSNLRIDSPPGDVRGTYAVTRTARLLCTDGSPSKEVAVKDLTFNRSVVLPFPVESRIACEMSEWCQVNHPNVLPFTGYHVSDDGYLAYLVSPFIEGGNIRNYLREHNPDSCERAYLVQDTLSGLKYLHDAGVCHGDLKSHNVLITNEKRALLCDFGLANAMHDQPTISTTPIDFTASFRWCSPEVLDITRPRDFFSDVWAWACLALEIMTSDLPYGDVLQDMAVVNWIIKKSTPASATRSCRTLPKGMLGLWDLCWSFDPSARPDAATCAKAWSICWNKVEWRSSFLEGIEWRSIFVDSTSVQSATVATVPSTRPTTSTVIPRLPNLHSHSRSWESPASTVGHPGETFTSQHHLKHLACPSAPVASNALTQQVDSDSRNHLVPESSASRTAPEALGDHDKVSMSNTSSQHISQLIIQAAKLDDRDLWIEVCESCSTPEGAKSLSENIILGLGYGAEHISLIAIRTWVLALRADYPSFLRLTSRKDFLRMLQGHYNSPQQPESVKAQLFKAIAGAACEFGELYPDFRWCWAIIKGYDLPFTGIAYDTDDAFFSLPPAPTTPRRRSSKPAQPVDSRWSTLVAPNPTYLESSPRTISPLEFRNGGWDSSLRANAPIRCHTPPERPATPVNGGGRLLLREPPAPPYTARERHHPSRRGAATDSAVPQVKRSEMESQLHHRRVQFNPVPRPGEKLTIKINSVTTMPDSSQIRSAPIIRSRRQQMGPSASHSSSPPRFVPSNTSQGGPMRFQPVPVFRKEVASTAPLVDDIGELIVFESAEPFDTRGNFCDLFVGTHPTAGTVALKRLRHRGGGEDNVEAMTRQFSREKDIWMELRHDRILQCLGMFTRERHLYLVSPFMKNGSLFDWLRSRDHIGLERLRLIDELADALAYLHLRGIVHGDVKANNVLLSDDIHVQLCDFGLTRLAESATTTTLKGAGSIRWQSPELWNNEPKSLKSDVYAFGMTVVEVLTSQVPFATILHDSGVIMAVFMQGERPGQLPDTSPDGISYSNARLVAERCWNGESGQRISMPEAVELFRLRGERYPPPTSDALLLS